MKATEFVNLIRKVIREEVRVIVKEELKAFKPVIVESKGTTVQKGLPPLQTKIQMPARKTNIPTFEGALASILNETAQSMMEAPQAAEYDEWPEMGAGPMTMNDVPAGMDSAISRQAAMSGDPTAAFMKDYSSTLKKAESIANQNYRP